MFSTILSKIFGQSTPANAPASGPAQSPSTTGSSPAVSPANVPVAAANAPASVDVSAVLSEMAAKNSESLDWKKSIVDLLKLLGMDSSLAARKELAAELHYSGDTSDSAAMNIWLHKEVLKKLAANGGKVPADLLD